MLTSFLPAIAINKKNFVGNWKYCRNNTPAVYDKFRADSFCNGWNYAASAIVYSYMKTLVPHCNTSLPTVPINTEIMVLSFLALHHRVIQLFEADLWFARWAAFISLAGKKCGHVFVWFGCANDEILPLSIPRGCDANHDWWGTEERGEEKLTDSAWLPGLSESDNDWLQDEIEI